jgi:hypothetical protein
MAAWWFGQYRYSLHLVFVVTSFLWLIGAAILYFTYVNVFNVNHEFEQIPLEDMVDNEGDDENLKLQNGNGHSPMIVEFNDEALSKEEEGHDDDDEDDLPPSQVPLKD